MTVAKVVDASAVAALIFGEPRGNEVGDLTRGSQLFAPMLIEFELANVCVKKCRELPERQAALLVAYASRTALPIELVVVDYSDVTALALRTELTGHDASYLWLALRLGLELVTLDKQLGNAARKL